MPCSGIPTPCPAVSSRTRPPTLDAQHQLSQPNIYPAPYGLRLKRSDRVAISKPGSGSESEIPELKHCNPNFRVSRGSQNPESLPWGSWTSPEFRPTPNQDAGFSEPGNHGGDAINTNGAENEFLITIIWVNGVT